MLGGMRGCLGCNLCEKRLRLSWKADECKPLERGGGAKAKGGLVGEVRCQLGGSFRILGGQSLETTISRGGPGHPAPPRARSIASPREPSPAPSHPGWGQGLTLVHFSAQP